MTAQLRETEADAIRASRMTRLRGAARIVLAAVAAGTFLALIGAFGSGEESLAFRLTYWIGVILVGTGMAYGVSHVVCRVIDAEARPWMAGVIVTLVLAVLITGFLAVISAVVFSHTVTLRELPRLYLEVLVITAAMTAFITAVERWPRSERTEATDVGPVRFLERLPVKLRGAELLAVSAEDHYLRIRTDQGEALVLMRLSDAIEELAGVEGARTHRSWWVARAAIEDVRRTDGRVILILKGGTAVPVSRTYAPSLRKAGWF